jgi:hypothetical protein
MDLSPPASCSVSRLRSIQWAGLTLGVHLCLATATVRAEPSELIIDDRFPGGNIVVERIEGDQVDLRPDLRDTQGWWFYWNFRVRGAQGRTLNFHFVDRNPIGVRGPAISKDQGRSWAWMGAQRVQDASFTYSFGTDDNEIRFCFAMPYLESDLHRFLAEHEDHPHLSVQQLCQTRQERSVELVLVGDPERAPRYRIFLAARHHACESMASYTLEGFLAAALADSDNGRWFREHAHLLAVPFVDKDGVQQGDQGKNRKPHDHNRDYRDPSIYPSIAAIRTRLPAWSRGRLDVALDLHCPWIRGPHNEVIYMVGSADPVIWQRQETFGAILQRVQRGPLKYRAADNLPFGKAWNTQANYGEGVSFGRWASQLDGIRLASTFEIPYANAAGTPVDADSARAFGHDLLRAVREFVSNP